jgi:hypothetical protein
MRRISKQETNINFIPGKSVTNFGRQIDLIELLHSFFSFSSLLLVI